MDLVVLLDSQDPATSSIHQKSGLKSTSDVVGGEGKGKGKAADVVPRTRVSLWRMSGSKVWDIEADGHVNGVAWSLDGETFVYGIIDSTQ